MVDSNSRQFELWLHHSRILCVLLTASFVLLILRQQCCIGREHIFLPIMDAANRKLMAGIEEKGQQEFNIEAVSVHGGHNTKGGSKGHFNHADPT